MEIRDVSRLATTLEGVRERSRDGLAQWRYRGRLVARQLGDDQIVIRTAFDRREVLLRSFPEAFSVPTRFAKHMMVVANLRHGDRDAIEGAVSAAWQLQRASVG
jgi:hypothetical protein